MRIILNCIFLLTFSFSAFADTIKHFNDYIDLTPTKKSVPEVCRVHLKGKQKINDRQFDPMYKDNSWKLVMRRGLFKAQVEQAMSEIYKYFIGYSTDLDFVEENKDLFIARREFTHFDKWDDIVVNNHDVVLIKNYKLLDNGYLVSDKKLKRFIGLGNVVALAEFFADNDAKHYNYGIQQHDDELRVIDYDLEDAFSFEEPSSIEASLGEPIIKMTWYLKEKKFMQLKIAKTDFSVIEAILRKHLTVTRLNSKIWLLEKILRDPTAYPQLDRVKIKAALTDMLSGPDTSQNIEDIIRELRSRHARLQQQVNRA